MKLNLNERLREVRENQKARIYKEMIHYLLFFTQTSYARLKLVHNLYRKKIFLTRCNLLVLLTVQHYFLDNLI